MTPAALESHLFVIIGASGDLTERKLLPAIHEIMQADPAETHVLGVSSQPWDDAEFGNRAGDAIEAAGNDRDDEWCRRCVHHLTVGRDDDYAALAEKIEQIEEKNGLPGNRIFYLALPPSVFGDAIERLGEAGLHEAPGWSRLVVEKPFGRDGASAKRLNEIVHRWWDEQHVFRIDHYLGKESVQNLLVFRFTNPLFEASWNRDRIDRIEITVAETVSVDDRGGYYDKAGVIRDMVQSHLTQLLTLVAMEPPVSFDADSIRAEKIKVLEALRDIGPDHVVAGQYTAGTAGEVDVPDYLDEPDVESGSTTPTYVALEVAVDSWRWQGVPFYLRTGKAMAERVTEIAVAFRPPPVCIVHGTKDQCVAHSNILYLTLQPNEGFRLEIEVKEPGDTHRIRTIPLSFSYSDAFGDIPDAYTTLLRDIVEGDQTLFVHSDEVELAWDAYDAILHAHLPLYRYAAGSWGPQEARSLLRHVTNWATG